MPATSHTAMASLFDPGTKALLETAIYSPRIPAISRMTPTIVLQFIVMQINGEFL